MKNHVKAIRGKGVKQRTVGAIHSFGHKAAIIPSRTIYQLVSVS